MLVLTAVALVILAGCGSSDAPSSEVDNDERTTGNPCRLRAGQLNALLWRWSVRGER